ncbi:ketopantoate reductase family protein [Gordonia sp. NPDC003376]
MSTPDALPRPSRYVIVGAGAVGATLAARFRRTGTDHVLVARGDQHVALTSAPLTFTTPDGVDRIPVTPAAGPEDVDLRIGDVLILAVKAQQVDAAVAQWASRPVGDAGDIGRPAGAVIPIVTLQNGIAAERAALRYFATVIGASIWIPATYVRPGAVTVYAADPIGLLWLGRYPHPTAADALDAAIAHDLDAAGIRTQLVDDITRWKTAKLLGNLGNAVDVFDATDDERAALTRAIDAEARQVLAVAGLDPADYGTESTLDIVGFGHRPIPGEQPSRRSTWQSLQRGAGSVETDYLNGEIVLLGRLHGIGTPINEAVTTALARAATDGAAPGTIPLHEIVDVGALRAPA